MVVRAAPIWQNHRLVMRMFLAPSIALFQHMARGLPAASLVQTDREQGVRVAREK
jgi:hypothetical protein